MKIFLKILRTLIGLPVVLCIWPIAGAFMSLCMLLVIIVSIIMWVATGQFQSECPYTRAEINDGIDTWLWCMTLPDVFLTTVWSK